MCRRLIEKIFIMRTEKNDKYSSVKQYSGLQDLLSMQNSSAFSEFFVLDDRGSGFCERPSGIK